MMSNQVEEPKYAPDVERRLVKDVPLAKVQRGKLRLWWTWHDADGPFTAHFAVTDVDEAKNLVKRLAAEQVDDDTVEYNAHGLEVWDEGAWSEWYSEDGDGLDEIMENEIDPDGPLSVPPLHYAKKPKQFGAWTYELDIKALNKDAEHDDPRPFDLALSNSLQTFIAEHPELKNDVELNWLATKFFVLGSSEGLNEFELHDRSQAVYTRFYDWANEGKRCWIES